MNIEEGQVPVVYQIEFHSEKGLFDMSGYSSYDHEKEVLIQDGLEYSVTKITKLKY